MSRMPLDPSARQLNEAASDDTAADVSLDDGAQRATLPHKLPKPIIRKMRWPYPLIWLVPICAAIGAGIYWYQSVADRGPTILLTVDDASGIKPGNSNVEHLGVTLGVVQDIELTPDHSRAVLKVQLNRKSDAFARQGARFWVVRPEISAGMVSGLSTITSGPYVEALPGYGSQISEFDVLPRQPQDLGPGMMLIMHAPRLEHLQAGSALTYRGIDVGAIQRVSLSHDATGIDVKVFVQKRYAALVHRNSKFWVTPGIDVKGGLFSGVQLKLESLRALLSGGITFATPEAGAGALAGDGDSFPLYSDPKKEWPEWSPHINLPETPGDDSNGSGAALPQAGQSAQSATK